MCHNTVQTVCRKCGKITHRHNRNKSCSEAKTQNLGFGECVEGVHTTPVKEPSGLCNDCGIKEHKLFQQRAEARRIKNMQFESDKWHLCQGDNCLLGPRCPKLRKGWVAATEEA